MKIVFMGTPQAAVPTLQKILDDGHEVVAVWTQPDKPAGRGKRLSSPPVKEFALENGLAVFQPSKIKNDEALHLFQAHQADLAVVVAYGKILPESFLASFPNGAINVHFSILPKYRGAAPVNWMIVNGEQIAGVTTMQMDAGLDTGDVLLQREINIIESETSIDLMERLSYLGADLLSDTLKHYDRLAHIPQNHDEASYAPIMKKQDGLIDWQLTAEPISNRIRGLQPFHASFTLLHGKKLTIWEAHPVFLNQEMFAAGEVVLAKSDKIIVACGSKTFLEIAELQLEGKKRMQTRYFLNGIKIENGEKFG